MGCRTLTDTETFEFVVMDRNLTDEEVKEAFVWFSEIYKLDDEVIGWAKDLLEQHRPNLFKKIQEEVCENCQKNRTQIIYN